MRSSRAVSLFALLFALGTASQALALGLGQAQVQSYYQQPLVARIDLISRSEAEMATVTAGLASPADFQVLGLTRTGIGTPLEFEIYRDLSDPHIRVTSQLPMNEPVVQLVVEVVWSSGRMLRQYTLFLDPPTFDAPAPLPAPSTQRPVPPAGETVAREASPDIERLEAPDASTSPFRDEAPPPPVATTPDVPLPASPVEAPPAGPPFDPVVDAPEPESPPEMPAEAQLADSPATPEASSTPLAEERPAEPVQEAIAQEAAVVTADDPAEVSAESPPEPVLEPVVESPLDSDAELAEAAPEGLRDEPVQDEVAETPGEVSSDGPIEEPGDASVAANAAEASALDEPLPPAPSAAPEPPAEPATSEPAPVARAVLPGPGQGTPDAVNVQRGDTLWGLSRSVAEAQGTTVNQVMLAVQQKNPGAFIDGNINALMAGEILRMPSRDEVLARNVRDAMLEVMRQEAVYRTRWDLPPSPDALPTISNLADAGPGASTSARDDADLEPEAGEEPAAPPEAATEEDSRLVLVPPSEGDATQGTGQGGSGETGVSSGESVVEELARAREELANAQQENAYLQDRLDELEAELARREGDGASGVADTNLAEMEDRLREERLSGEEAPELALPERDGEAGWLSRYGYGLAGLVILVIAGLVWFLRSRRDPEYTPGLEESTEPAPEPEAAREPDSQPTEPESDDPETLLDLARAYMAMGKNPQARDCIEAVIRIGSPDQVREARDMLAEL